MSTRYDEVFANIAGGCGGIDPLLEAFFGFLHRRTDFYVTVEGENVKSEMGFRPGVQRAMLMKAFEKYPMKLYSPPAVPAPPPLISSATTTSSSSVSSSSSSSPKLLTSVGSSVTSAESSGEILPEGGSQHCNSNNTKSSSNTSTAAGDSIIPPAGVAIKKPELGGKFTEDGKQIPIGNGGWTDCYYWTQTLKDATVYVDLPNGTKGKNVKCTIGKKSLSLKLNDKTLIEGELHEAVKTDESLWNISADSKTGRTTLIINLDKGRETWWKSVIVGDPEIDCTKVDSTQRIDDYDEQTQAAIRKLMTEHRDKRLAEHAQPKMGGGSGGNASL